MTIPTERRKAVSWHRVAAYTLLVINVLIIVPAALWGFSQGSIGEGPSQGDYSILAGLFLGVGAALALDFIVAAGILGGIVAREATYLVLGMAGVARTTRSHVTTPRVPSDAAMVGAWEQVKVEMGIIDRPPEPEECWTRLSAAPWRSFGLGDTEPRHGPVLVCGCKES